MHQNDRRGWVSQTACSRQFVKSPFRILPDLNLNLHTGLKIFSSFFQNRGLLGLHRLLGLLSLMCGKSFEKVRVLFLI